MNNQFPSKPKVSMVCYTIYLQPNLTINENIAVLVIALNSNEIITQHVLSEELVKVLFKDKANRFYPLISTLDFSIQEEFNKFKSIDNWIPPFEGARLSKKCKRSSTTKESIINQQIKNTSNFGTLLWKNQ